MRTRRWMWGAVIVGLLALVTWALVRVESSDGTPASQRAARANGTPLAPHADTGSQRPGAGLRIRGTVVDKQGAPVAGVRVSASGLESGRTLSELPCPVDPLAPPGPRSRKLPECMTVARELVIELVGAREGDAPVYAETTTGADGAFVLDGLSEGTLAVWAVGERGAGMRDGVPAGTEGVEVVLEEGVAVRGTVSGGQQPLAGARVTVFDMEHPRFFDATTGPDGRFDLGHLPRGDLSYALVTKEGWFPQLTRLVMANQPVTLRRASRLSVRVLSHGAPVPGATVRMSPGEHLPGDGVPGDTTDAEGRFAWGVATGSTHTLTASHEGRYALARVTPGPALPEVVLELGSALQVEGTVADEAGRPVADATVKVNPLGMAYPTLRAVTDAKGRYRVGPVEPGEWSFLAEAPGHLDMVRSDYHTLGPATGPVDLTLTRAASVTGRVTDVEGQPLRDIRLSLALPSAAEASKRALPRENAWTDAEGRFVIDAEEAGDYLLRVTDAPYLDVSVPVRAPSGAVHLTLEAGASVEGTLADARGLRLEGFRVELQDPEGKEELSLGRRASTDAKGHFLLQGVPPGRYVLVASRNALSAARRAWREVELRAGTRTQVELRMEPERTLPGIVVDDAGQPLKDVHIRARPPQRDGPVWKQDWRHLGHHGAPLGIKTGPDGRFVLEGLTEPTYDVSASVRGYTFAPGRSTGGLGEQEQGLLRVGADTAQVRLVMARDAHLIGRVVGPEGAPIPRFDVNGYPMEDASGAFSVPARDTGSQSLVFRAEGLALRVLQLEPHTGPGDQDVGVVRMSRGRGLQGQVVDAVTGEPLADASLDLVSRAMDGHGNPVSQASRSTDEDGTFDWPHLDLEAFTLTVSLEGYQAQRLTVGPEQETVTVRLDPGARVEVTVKDLKGRPRDATVEFHGDDGTFASEVAVRGALVQRGLKPGPYTVRLMPEDSMDQRFPTFLPQRVVVPATGRVQVSFRAREGGATVRLRVPDDFRSDALLLPRSVPLPARREDLERLVAQSVPSKAVGDETVFHHVPPGRATILVIHPDGPTQFHSEELEVPAGDTLSRVLSPVWRAFGTAADPQVAEERGGGEGEADARGQQ